MTKLAFQTLPTANMKILKKVDFQDSLVFLMYLHFDGCLKIFLIMIMIKTYS